MQLYIYRFVDPREDNKYYNLYLHCRLNWILITNLHLVFFLNRLEIFPKIKVNNVKTTAKHTKTHFNFAIQHQKQNKNMNES